VYCRTGRRAGILKKRLADAGYLDVQVVQEDLAADNQRMIALPDHVDKEHQGVALDPDKH